MHGDVLVRFDGGLSEQCQSGSPGCLSKAEGESRPGGIPTFYPMIRVPLRGGRPPEWGRRGHAPASFWKLGPSFIKAGEAADVPRNPVRGGSGSLTPFNPAGVGSFEPGDRPNRVS
jgi:hypothetical protein